MKVIWTLTRAEAFPGPTSSGPVPVSSYGAGAGCCCGWRPPDNVPTAQPSGFQLKVTSYVLIFILIFPFPPPPGIPTDDEQATGLERRALQALKRGKVGSAHTVDISNRTSPNVLFPH